jgi:hypothetical protein
LRHAFSAEAIQCPKQHAIKLSPGSTTQERGELLSLVSAPSATLPINVFLDDCVA